MTDKKKARKRSAARIWFAPRASLSEPSAIARAHARWGMRRKNGRTPGDRDPQYLVGCAARTHRFKTRVDDVKRGILLAGGFPMELPALSLSESFLKPTTMLYRNLLAMDAEELLRGHPVDGVVLMGGCDKTTPALLLGATSMGLPAIYLPAGPMLRGNWKGKTLGSGSDAWKYWDERRAGKISDKDWVDVEAGIARSYGTCMTMGTASTSDCDRQIDRA